MIRAEYNHGRWVAVCPACLQENMQVAEVVKFGDIFICPVDYPNLHATTLMPNPRVPGAFNPVPDLPLREETRQKAIADGAAQEIIFPENWKEIENALRVRPVSARNWQPGTTLEELQEETERMTHA